MHAPDSSVVSLHGATGPPVGVVRTIQMSDAAKPAGSEATVVTLLHPRSVVAAIRKKTLAMVQQSTPSQVQFLSKRNMPARASTGSIPDGRNSLSSLLGFGRRLSAGPTASLTPSMVSSGDVGAEKNDRYEEMVGRF